MKDISFGQGVRCQGEGHGEDEVLGGAEQSGGATLGLGFACCGCLWFCGCFVMMVIMVVVTSFWLGVGHGHSQSQTEQAQKTDRRNPLHGSLWIGRCEVVNLEKALTTISRSTGEKLRKTFQLEGWVFFLTPRWLQTRVG